MTSPTNYAEQERRSMPGLDERAPPTAAATVAEQPSTYAAAVRSLPQWRQPVAYVDMYLTKVPSTWSTSFCGAMAGMASGIVTCPLDVIKTKLQAQVGRRGPGRTAPSKAVYSGMIGTARVIWTQEGLRGMYRGLGPMLLGYLPTWAVYMSVYEGAKEYYYSKTDRSWLARASAAVTAGACSTVVTNPIWVIKTRLMSQGSARVSDDVRPPWQYRSTLDAARQMYRSEGARVFYSGLAPALLGLSHVAIQFPLYEYFKTRFTGSGMGQQSAAHQQGRAHWLGIAAATFLSKICATSATYPHEVLRTRLQTQHRAAPPAHSLEGISFRGGIDSSGPGPRLRPPGTASSDGMINLPRYRGVVPTFVVILRDEGWRAFYNGMGTNMIRAVPAAMTTMLTFEWLRSLMHRMQADGVRYLRPDDSRAPDP